MHLLKHSVYLLILIASLFSCKKNNNILPEENPLNPACDSSSKFKVSFNEQLYPFSVCEADDGSIYILTKNDEIGTIMRVSGTGNLLTKKEYSLGSGFTPQHIIQLNSNSFIFSAANAESFDSMVCYPYHAWYTGFYYKDTNQQCKFNYVFETGTGMGTFTTQSKSHLYKIDSSLNILWEIPFSGVRFYGNSIAKMDDQHFVFMTYHSGGQVPYPVFDTWGAFLDTVKYDFYGNSATVYKMDESGNVIWQTEVDSIYSSNLTLPSSGCDVVTDGTNIFLRMQHEIIILNGNGSILSRFNVHGYCDEEIRSIASLPGNGFVCQGYYIPDVEPNFFLSRFSSNGTLLWDMPLPSSSPYSRLFSCNGNIFDHFNQNICKYNEQGVLLWTKTFDYASYGIDYYSSANCGCNGGILLVAGSGIDEFLIYKTDANGNF